MSRVKIQSQIILSIPKVHEILWFECTGDLVGALGCSIDLGASAFHGETTVGIPPAFYTLHIWYPMDITLAYDRQTLNKISDGFYMSTNVNKSVSHNYLLIKLF